jgi:hypothetical protein
MAASVFLTRTQTLNSTLMQKFEDLYRSNLHYDASRGLWVGQHVSSSFIVDLLKQDTLGDIDGPS